MGDQVHELQVSSRRVLPDPHTHQCSFQNTKSSYLLPRGVFSTWAENRSDSEEMSLYPAQGIHANLARVAFFSLGVRLNAMSRNAARRFFAQANGKRAAEVQATTKSARISTPL